MRGLTHHLRAGVADRVLKGSGLGSGAKGGLRAKLITERRTRVAKVALCRGVDALQLHEVRVELPAQVPTNLFQPAPSRVLDVFGLALVLLKGT